MKRSVCDCGYAFASKKRKARCTAVGEPENAMKHGKALLSEEELLMRRERDKVRKASKKAYVSKLCTGKNRNGEHIIMASMRASERFEHTIHRHEQNPTHMGSMRASETFEYTIHRQEHVYIYGKQESF